MQDTIIKGSGNSRSIRFPPNAISIWPSWDAFLADAISAAGAPCDFGPLNPTGVQVAGTDLTKGNLLTDETATGMGLTGAATPNDAFSKLKQMIDGKCKVESGSYAGSLPSSQGSPSPVKNITFSFYPKVFLLISDGEYKNNSYNLITYSGIIAVGIGSIVSGYYKYSRTASTEVSYSNMGTISSNKVSLTPSFCNGTGATYYYAAIG